MFPSWLWHEVKPNESNQTRISVSFNFLQRDATNVKELKR